MSRPALTHFRILGAGGFAQRLNPEDRRDLRDSMREMGMTPIRRANRFIHLAVMGMVRCRDSMDHPAPTESGVYLGTAHGSFTDTVTLIEQHVREGLPVTPFRFVNVLSNVAGFHVATLMAINGENLAVARLHGAFDAALETASLDLALGETDCALVGGVDEGDEDLTMHRRRTGTPARRMPGEGAGWLALARAEDGDEADLIHLGDFSDWKAIRRRVSETDPDRIAAGPGVWHRPGSLAKALPGYPVWDYHEQFGFSPTNTAIAMAEHFRHGRGSLLHIDRTGPQRQWRLWLLHSRG